MASILRLPSTRVSCGRIKKYDTWWALTPSPSPTAPTTGRASLFPPQHFGVSPIPSRVTHQKKMKNLNSKNFQIRELSMQKFSIRKILNWKLSNWKILIKKNSNKKNSNGEFQIGKLSTQIWGVSTQFQEISPRFKNRKEKQIRVRRYLPFLGSRRRRASSSRWCASFG